MTILIFFPSNCLKIEKFSTFRRQSLWIKFFDQTIFFNTQFCADWANIRNATADGTLWARIAQNIKKPSLTVNVINFDFLVLMYPYVSLGVPLVPKSHDTLVELFRFTRYVERNKVHFAPFLRFHWNHYIAFPDFSDVWPSWG